MQRIINYSLRQLSNCWKPKDLCLGMADGSDQNDGEPQCLPLKTLDAVLEWSPGNDDFCVATVPLSSAFKGNNQYPRTMVCHDMAGGYLDDRFVQGVNKDDCYRFYEWRSIDSFIYFSHHFVTIPPPSWTNPAHKHGVLMLGTFITEWDVGAERCRNVFQSAEDCQRVADKLVQIAVYYRFDGWLINIENPIQLCEMETLKHFVKYLTEKMHAAVAHSLVIWYDSVIETGQLQWQDEVNKKNCFATLDFLRNFFRNMQREQLLLDFDMKTDSKRRVKMIPALFLPNPLKFAFFDACDGIFLNYCWKDANLVDSAKLCCDKSRPLDVYVGVDVFGRGCLGGGGYNTKEAVQAARNHNLSAAIFAPGWVYEKHGAAHFTENQNKFWGLLAPYLQTKKLRNLPVITTFGQGFGKHFYVKGKLYSDQPWTNQSLQPLQYGVWPCDGATLCVDEAYTGGSSLKLSASDCPSSSQSCYKLYDCDVHLPGEIFVSYTFKPQNNCDVCLQLVMEKTDGTSAHVYLASDTDSEQDTWMKSFTIKGDIVKPLHLDEVPKCWVDLTSGEDNGLWKTRVYSVKEEHSRLINVSVCCLGMEAHTAEQDSAVLLGDLKIMSAHDAHSAHTIPPLNVTASDTSESGTTNQQAPDVEQHECRVSTTLSWNHVEGINYFSVYHRDPGNMQRWRHLGCAMVDRFRVCELAVERSQDSVEFCVQPITCLGYIMPISKCGTCIVNIKSI